MPSTKTKKRSSKKSKGFEGIRQQLIAGQLDELIEEYEYDPVAFLGEMGRTYPPKLERVLLDVYSGAVTEALLKACRGGGKSQLLSGIGAVMYLFRNFDVLMLGGSAAQSKNDYNYTSEILTDNPTIESFSEDVLTSVATSKKGNWLKCLAASTTAVRGPHAGDPHKEMGYEKHGGLLEIDEECEAKEEVVRAAMYTNNTADPAVTVRASTFHQAIGTFADAIDHAEEWGYTVYEWDCFDIAEPCTDKCEECFVEFAGKLHPKWSEFLKENPSFKPYCEGKARTASDGKGWMKISKIKHYFKSSSREEFEVEMLGWRPSAAGLVLDPNNIERCIVDDTFFMPGMPGVIGIDWGYAGLTVVGALQKQKDNKIALLEGKGFHLTPDAVIYEYCKRLREEYGFWKIRPDASHPFQNANLANEHGFQVEEVQFGKSKDLGVGVLKHWTENTFFQIPRRFTDCISQLKNWRKKDGKIVKKNDHWCDMLLAAATEWADDAPYVIEAQSSGVLRQATAVEGRF